MSGSVETLQQLFSDAADGQAAGAYTLARLRNLIASLAEPPNTVETSSYAALLTDAYSTVEMNVAGANNFTVPPNSSVAFPIGTRIEVYQLGAGQTTIVAGSGVTFQTPTGTLSTRAQYSTVTLRQRATNVWVIGGDLS